MSVASAAMSALLNCLGTRISPEVCTRMLYVQKNQNHIQYGCLQRL